MDAAISPEEDTAFIDTYIPDTEERTDSALMRESLNKEVEQVLSILPETERAVLKLYYGINTTHEYTLDEIGDKLDISRERVRQIKERALKTLRQKARNTNFSY
jgi:RNA polymerase primary sigma factor